MKKVLSILICFCIIMSTFTFVGITANAETYGYYTYEVTNGEAEIVECKTTISGIITIPSTLNGYPVTSIGEGAFWGCTSIKSVTIPNSITTIGEYAFKNCKTLTAVSLSISISEIQEATFDNCSSLKSITIPNNVVNIGVEAFDYCTSLESVIIGDRVENIGEWAFSNCTSLTNVVFGKNVKTIGYRSFMYCSSLKSITIPNGVTRIDADSFRNCTSLASITIPDSVTDIGSWAFGETSYYLNRNNWENDVLYIDNCLITGRYSHYNMNTDKETEITVSGDYIVKEGTRVIADSAFDWCNSLTNVTIPKNVSNIGDNVFDPVSLKNIFVSIENNNYASVNGVLFDKNIEVLIQYPRAKTDSDYIIPNSVTTISNNAFWSCVSLTEVTIPNSVTTIGNNAFAGCLLLNSISIGNNVTYIGEYAFPSNNKNLIINCGCNNEYVTNYAKNLGINYTQHEFTHYYSNNDASCVTNATETAKCENCDAIDVRTVENTALGHDFTILTYDETEHWYKCSRCDSTNGHTTHEFLNYVSNNDATCTENGTETAKCTRCDQTDTREDVDSALGHAEVVDKEVESTCTETGLTEGKHCSSCGEVFTIQEEVPALGHTQVIDKAVKATCTKTGLTEGSHCSVCNKVLVEQKTVKSLGHKYKWVTTKKATYFAKGTSSYKCTVCGKVAKTKSIAKLVLKKPTFKLTGAKGKFTVKYTKVTGATGFQVRYKLGSGKYKSVKVNTKKSISKVISKLKKGKYTVQVRAFVKSGSKTAYSSWASAKKVTVK